MNLSKYFTIFATITGLVVAPEATAAARCTGRVLYLSVDSGGGVSVQIENSTPIHTICNMVAQGAFTSNVQACKAQYSMLLSARISGLSVGTYYNSISACNQISNWSQQTSFHTAEML